MLLFVEIRGKKIEVRQHGVMEVAVTRRAISDQHLLTTSSTWIVTKAETMAAEWVVVEEDAVETGKMKCVEGDVVER